MKHPSHNLFVGFRELAQQCTLPIIGERGNRNGICGTGTLFQIGERYFLVTAAHVINPLRQSSDRDFAFGVPTSRTHGAGVEWSKGTFVGLDKIDTNNEPDIGFFEFSDPAFVSKLQKGWRFLSLSHVHVLGPTRPNTHYLVFGYPESMSRKHGNNFRTGPLTYISVLYNGKSLKDLVGSRPQDHLFLQHNGHGVSDTNAVIKVPAPHGISGCAIWVLFDAASNEIWSPSTHAKVVAVETAYKDGEYIRGTTWHAVLRTLREAYSDLRAPIDAYFGSTNHRQVHNEEE